MAATRATELANELKKKATKAKAESAHLFGKTPSEESIVSRIKNWGEKIKKLQVGVGRSRRCLTLSYISACIWIVIHRLGRFSCAQQ